MQKEALRVVEMKRAHSHSPPAPVRRPGWLRSIVVRALRLLVTTANQIVVVPGWFCLIVLVQPLRLFGHSCYLRAEGRLYKHLLDLVAYWGWVQGFYVFESGDAIEKYAGVRCLMLPNHQSTADIPTLFALFQSKREVVENIMWVSDWELMFSHIGIVCLIHGDMFIRQKLGSAQREKTLLKIEQHLKDKFVAKSRRWCVVFPEGGFFRKRKAASQLYAQKKGLPMFERLSGPRVFGVEKLIKSVEKLDAKKPFEYIIDVTVAYQDQSRCLGLPDWLISGKYPESVHVHCKVIPISELKMESTESLEKSLFEVWAEKEKRMQNFYRFGYFESEKEPQKLCRFSDIRCLKLNSMYACLSFACWRYGPTLFHWVMNKVAIQSSDYL